MFLSVCSLKEKRGKNPTKVQKNDPALYILHFVQQVPSPSPEDIDPLNETDLNARIAATREENDFFEILLGCIVWTRLTTNSLSRIQALHGSKNRGCQ